MSLRDAARIRKNKLDVWRQYIELGRSAYLLGQFGIGEKMLKAASHESRADEEMCVTLATTLEELADELAEQSSENIDRAERLYKKAIGVFERLKTDERNASSCRVLYKLAQLSVQRNRHEVALRYFGKALIVSRRSQTLPVETHLCMLNKLAAAWSQKGRHSEAMLVHNKSVQISESL
jgi:tetratricopeptide (TPR) repeat protein